MLKLMLGRSGTGKTETIIRTIANCGGARPRILIVPEQHSHDMERRLCALGGAAVSGYAEVLSFTRLANRVSSVVGGLAAPVLDPGGRVLLMYAAVQAVADKLTIYQRPSRRPAFLTGLLATVDELKACRISSSDLWQAWEETGEEDGAKLRDLSLIYGAYQAMTERRAADPRDWLTRLAEGLKECRWAEGKDFYLDGFTDFTAQERQVIEQLMRQGASVTVALTCGGVDGEETVFAPARRTARQLLAMAREACVPAEFCRTHGAEKERSAALTAVEQALSVGAEPRGGCEGISLYRACSPYSELEWVASEILRLVREEGYRFRDITVTGRSLEGREENLVILFRRYGIPAFFSAMSDVLQRPVFAVVMAALAAASGGYQYEDLFRYLKTGLAGIDGEERDLLENYALKWDLKGSRWTEKRPWAMHPRGYGLDYTEEDTALLERLNGVRRRVVEPLERLRKSGPDTGRGWAAALYAFLQEINLPDTLLRRADELTEAGDPALADEYGQLWDILCEALEQCAALLNETEMGLEEFAKLLGLCLSQYDVGTIPVSVDRVAVGDMPRMAHKPCKALFLIGADDGSIPQPGTSPGLLNDDDRSLLSSFGLETAPGRTERLDREMTMVYETCALPSARLTVSWSAAGSGERNTAPPFWWGACRSCSPN